MKEKVISEFEFFSKFNTEKKLLSFLSRLVGLKVDIVQIINT